MDLLKGAKREMRYRTKVANGFRVVIPKDIVGIYKVKKGDMVEWIYDGEGNVRIEIKEMVLRDKKAKVERVNKEEGKRLKVEKVRDRDVGDEEMKV